jgi:hypothetical protein
VTTGAHIDRRPNGSLYRPKLAWAVSEAALVWADAQLIGGGESLRILLLHLAPDGTALGSPIILSDGMGAPPTGLSIASDGNTYVVGWNDDTPRVTLVSVPVGQSAVTMGAVMPGAGPALAARPEGFALAYYLAGELRFQALDGAQLRGAPVPVEQGGSGGPTLVPTASGWAVAYLTSPSAKWTLRRLAPDGSDAGGSPIALSDGPSRLTESVALAADGDVVTALFASNEQAFYNIAFDAANQPSSPTRIDDMSLAPFGDVAAAPAASSFALAWVNEDKAIIYRAAGLNGTPLGAAQNAEPIGTDGADLDMIPTSDGFLVASTLDDINDAIAVFHLACR